MEGKQPEIGVIMSVYNEKPSWLCEAIDSILEQTFQGIRLYILLDKPDNEELRCIIKEYQRKDTRIQFYENKQNLGLVKSLNKLISLVEEPYIARMDADDISLRERLQKEIDFLERNHLDFVMAGADYIDEENQKTTGDDIPNLNSKQIAECSKYGNVSIHSTWLLKRWVYEDLNGYRECKYCEDYDFILRCLQQNVKIGRLGEKLQLYRFRNTGITAQNAYEQDEKVAYLRKCYRTNQRIDSLKIEDLNKRFSGASGKQREKYCEARKKIDQLAQYLYCGDNKEVLKIFLTEGLTNKYFRKMFWNKFTGKMRLKRIYQNREKI